MFFVETSEIWLRTLSQSVSPEWFVFLGSLAEEIISPIPAMLVTGITGALALASGDTWGHIGTLAMLASVGKTIGAYVYYFIGDTLEDLLIGTVGKWIGVRHTEIENVGKRFTGHHWKDGGMLFLIRVFPFLPTTPVSIVCGIFKMNWRVFLGATFGGYFLKDVGYIAIGYFGFAAIENIWKDIAFVKQFIDIAVGIAIVWFFFFLYEHRHKGRHIWHCACRWFDRKN